jgi:hypothetical protein
MNASVKSFKQRAHELIDQLPDTADWKDLEYEISLRLDIEQGLRDSDEGRVNSSEEVRRRFGLKD